MGMDRELTSLAERAPSDSNPRQLLARLNKRLAALHLRMEVFLVSRPFCIGRAAVTYRQNQYGKKVRYSAGWLLGYAKVVPEGWSLVARPVFVKYKGRGEIYTQEDISDQAPARALLKAPREVQVAAVELLPKLLAEIRARVRTTVRGIQWARLLPEAVAQLHVDKPADRGHHPKRRND